MMSDMSFDRLLVYVLAWWPEEIICAHDDFTDPMTFSSISNFYDDNIRPVAAASGSMFASQLSWIIFGILHDVSQKMLRVYPHEIRPNVLRDRFHDLLRKVAIPQLHGDKEWDSTFGKKEELIAYLEAEGIPYKMD